MHNSVSADEALEWKETYGFDFPILVDDADVYEDYKLDTDTQPLSVLVGPDMTILARDSSYNGHHNVVALIPDLL